MSAECNSKVIQTQPNRACCPPRKIIREELCEIVVNKVASTSASLFMEDSSYGLLARITFFNSDTSGGDARILTTLAGIGPGPTLLVPPGNSGTIFGRFGSASVAPVTLGTTIDGQACIAVFKEVFLLEADACN